MPMKQPSDLSPQEFVFVHDYRTQDDTVLEVSLRIHPKPSADFSVEGKSLDDLRELGILKSAAEAFSNQEPNRASVSQIKFATGDVAWRVLNSDAAEAGWGPFLYDIAMELATQSDAGLCSHESDVSEDALRVWENYLSNRSDVKRTKLKRNLKPKRRDECLQYMYHKSPPLIVDELKRLSKWIETYTVLESE